MMTERELLANIYAFFNARAMDPVLEAMHPEVDWPNGMEGGRVHGRAGVRDYWTRQWSMIDPHVEPVGFATEDDARIAVSVHQTVRDLSGKVLLDQMVEHVYRIEDGLIRSMEIRSPTGA
jgi:ketosteroid isomerase-like protein